jgi:hypothetical protein
LPFVVLIVGDCPLGSDPIRAGLHSTLLARILRCARTRLSIGWRGDSPVRTGLGRRSSRAASKPSGAPATLKTTVSEQKGVAVVSAAKATDMARPDLNGLVSPAAARL